MAGTAIKTGKGATTGSPVVSNGTTNSLENALDRLARGTPTDLDALLHDVESHALVNGTRVAAHCHCLQLDGNGRPRIDSLVEAVAEHVLDYAIPRSEYRAVREEADRSRSSQKLLRLAAKAQKLFTDLDQSGEGGELLLFMLAEKVLRLPQLICKMSLKTNSRMHIHGADGLHAGVEPKTGKLLLYWGESKVFGDVTSAVRDCLKSLAPMLQDHEASKRDLHLLQRNLDVDDEDLENALKRFLDPDDPAFNSLEFRGLCLVGFDCDAYPSGPSTKDLNAVVSAIASTLPSWKGHVAKRVAEEKLDGFAMHFLFLPFPSAEDFRKRFREHLGLVPSTTTAAPAAKKVKSAKAGIATPPPKRKRTTRKNGGTRGSS